MTKTLIMVDLQNDFMPGGSLPVAHGNEVVAVANKIQFHFDHIIATKDWHPQNHGSFANNHTNKKPGEIITLDGLQQILWPVHCVQNTHGAEFHPDLKIEHINKIFYKGIDPLIDSYSAFFDNAHRRATGLHHYLLDEQQIKEVYILGVATDYCVKFTVLDALHLGLKVNVIEDACRGVNLNANDSADAIKEMKAAGARIIVSKKA